MISKLLRAIPSAVLLLFTPPVLAATQGVTDDTIRLGIHTDLSGPVASWGVTSTNGIRLRFDELNAAGGVHGRQIELLVEDTGYKVAEAVKAANKLVHRDKIFAMFGALGTPTNLAAMEIQFEANVPNLFPFAPAKAMSEPVHPLKFSYIPSYQKQARAGIRYFVETAQASKVCLQSVANDYGQEVETAFDDAVNAHGLTVNYRGTHKATETEFAGVASRIMESGCDLLVLGTIVKDTILLVSTLHRMGFTAPVVANVVPYLPVVAAAADGALNGLYAVPSIPAIDFDQPDAAAKRFADAYRTMFDAEPTYQAQSGYVFADALVEGLKKAGRELTVESLIKALESISDYTDPFGLSRANFSTTDHEGVEQLSLTQVQNRKWKTLKVGLPY